MGIKKRIVEAEHPLDIVLEDAHNTVIPFSVKGYLAQKDLGPPDIPNVVQVGRFGFVRLDVIDMTERASYELRLRQIQPNSVRVDVELRVVG
jgi:hypothetical protein